MTQPTTTDAPDDAITDVAGLAELAASHAGSAELDRRLSPRTARAIVSAGFARHFVPARWGGAEGGFAEYLAGVAAVAEGDPAAAWCASIAGTMGRMAGFLPEEGQRAVWGEGPDAFVVGGLIPAGTAEPADGGWLLSGRWPYMSGVHWSDHAMLACAVPTPEGGERGEREVRFLLVPRAAYAIEDSWYMVGMRGTGSDTLVLEPTFVPYEHSCSREELIAGRAPDAATAAACHRVPLKGVSGLSFAAPVLGAARGALRAWSAMAAARRSAPSAHRQLASGDAAADAVLARAAGLADAAELLLQRAAADADRGALTAPLTAARAHRDQALAADLLVDVVNLLFRNAGTRGQSDTSPFQPFWRDANAGAGHAVLQFEPAATAYARLALAELAELADEPGLA
jgi:alkylation response protein AidB-like acyl-CoA dehydrogenase